MLLDFSSPTIVIVYCCKRQCGHTPLAPYFLKQGLTTFASICVSNVAGMAIYGQGKNAYSDIGLPSILTLSNLLALHDPSKSLTPVPFHRILQLRKKADMTESQLSLSREHSRIIHDAFTTRRTVMDIWAAAEFDAHEEAPIP
ncbi:hypothetical protein B0H34DRAFT_673739 [Crassisporium funariophilum]|nr:hypothetical protein B0H34DRAFT_673739 [Crassisporium funariophilum]